jgi:hypothetical protein
MKDWRHQDHLALRAHRVELTELEQVNNELIKWIKETDEQAK